MPQHDEHTNWYVRRGSAVQGPYAARQIARYLLLGRVRHTDRVSIDGEGWMLISELPELIPDEMQDLESEAGRARFLAAHIRADERIGERSSVAQEGGWRGGKDRRRRLVNDDLDYVRHLAARYVDAAQGSRPLHPVLLGGALSLVLLTGALTVGVMLSAADPRAPTTVDCASSPRERANWAYCVKDRLPLPGVNLRQASLRHVSMRDANLARAVFSGADLSYGKFSNSDFSGADLSAARLVGADFASASLRNANLRQAELRSANLLGADIADADFDEALLDDAVWVNGRACQPGSIGRCRQ